MSEVGQQPRTLRSDVYSGDRRKMVLTHVSG